MKKESFINKSPPYIIKINNIIIIKNKIHETFFNS